MKYTDTTQIVQKLLTNYTEISADTITAILSYRKPDLVNIMLDKLDTTDMLINIGSGNGQIVHKLLSSYNNFSILQKCVNKMSTLKCPDFQGWYPVHYALVYQSVEVAQYIIDNTEDLEQCVTIDGYAPIHFACLYSNQDIIYYMIFDKGQDTKKIVSTYGGKPVQYSCLNLIELNNKLTDNNKDILITMMCEMII
jgi:ankyrin repeat protein